VFESSSGFKSKRIAERVVESAVSAEFIERARCGCAQDSAGYSKLRLLVVSVVLFCATVMPAPASTITATNTNDSSPGSVRQSLRDATDGDATTFGNTGMFATAHSQGLLPHRDDLAFASVGVRVAGIARYNGPKNGPDTASAIAVDASGNVFVTGSSEGLGGDLDYATIKYSAGRQRWVARYNGPGNSADLATAMAVDNLGNVYVTGWSYAAPNTNDVDYATIKYNSAGEEQWVARYNGPGNLVDSATAIAIDGSGNVYVTGNSWGSGNSDYATVKYNSAGEQQWVARYNGGANYGDFATAIAVDKSGNVYVTGDSGYGNSDYVTIKYNSAGEQQWVARYDGPGHDLDAAYAIAVDASDNVYVTGFSGGAGTDLDYATIKYDSAGQQQWVARYDGPVSRFDEAAAMAIDGSGNVYVTGISLGSDTVIDFVTVKYDSLGQEQWVARYTNGGGSAIALDSSANVYVTGYSNDPRTGTDYATIKYNPAGQEQWVARYNGPANDTDQAAAIAVDAVSNVYVAGKSTGWGSFWDYATIKYQQLPAGPPRPMVPR
jgi:uncharacterized delta-60 repeat protein